MKRWDWIGQTVMATRHIGKKGEIYTYIYLYLYTHIYLYINNYLFILVKYSSQFENQSMNYQDRFFRQALLRKIPSLPGLLPPHHRASHQSQLPEWKI